MQAETQVKRNSRSSVKRVDQTVFECEECGQVWSPNLLPGGRFPRGYRTCPNGCNDGDAERREQ